MDNKLHIVLIGDKTINTNYTEKFRKEFEYFSVFENYSEFKRSEISVADILIIEEKSGESDLIDFVYELRNSLHKNPFIYILSDNTDEFFQLALYGAGANDILHKKERIRIIIAKIKAYNSLKFSIKDVPFSENQNVYLNKEKYTVKVNGKEHSLPKKEYDLLNLLLSKTEKVFTREEILIRLWGSDDKVNNRIIDVHIRKLREKTGGDYIKTIKGVGYYISK